MRQLIRGLELLGVALRLIKPDERADGRRLSGQHGRGTLGEAARTLAFVTMDAVARQQPLEASEQALLKVRFTTPGLEEEQCQHSSEQRQNRNKAKTERLSIEFA